jgi:hypothetical protein
VLAAAGLAGCGGHHKPKLRPAVPTQETPLVRRLLAALDLERQTIAAYAAGLPLLGHPARDAAQHFLDQELSHAGEIAGLIEAAGVKAPKAGSVYDLGQPAGVKGVIELLHDLEQRQLTLYLDLVPQVGDGKVRAALTAVLGSDAQHLALLAGLLGENPIPSALL